MSLVLAVPPDLQGKQQPRVAHWPEYATSTGQEALELCRLAGLNLDPWQELVLVHSLGERPDGKWAAFEVGVCVGRQNGKGAILEARELTGLFLLPEMLLIHSAHQFDTSLEAFRRLLYLVEETPELDRRVKRVSRSHGEEGIELKDGSRIRFRTRTAGGGRGFSCDWLALDEAMFLPETAHGALLPTLSARPNSQVWYTGSAVDQLIHENGVVFARVRARGHEGQDPGLAYFEWSADFPSPDDLSDEAAGSPDAWTDANPGLGIRISPEHVANEQRSMDRRTFAVERLGVGDWPRTDGYGQSVIDVAQWKALADPESTALDPICFAFDVSPDRTRASIAAVGKRADGEFHAEIVDRRAGTGWLVERVVQLYKNHSPLAIICDSVGPAASILNEFEPFAVEVQTLSTQQHAQACGLLFDAVERSTIRHLGTQDLLDAIKGAATRPLGDAWAWSRKNSSVDITPLVATTLALWGAVEYQHSDGGVVFF